MVLDTSYILGQSAVKDTCNLLADGILQLVRGLAESEGTEPAAWAAAAIDWNDPAQRKQLLGNIVGDADGLLETTRGARGGYEPPSCQYPESPRSGQPAGPFSAAGHRGPARWPP